MSHLSIGGHPPIPPSTISPSNLTTMTLSHNSVPTSLHFSTIFQTPLFLYPSIPLSFPPSTHPHLLPSIPLSLHPTSPPSLHPSTLLQLLPSIPPSPPYVHTSFHPPSIPTSHRLPSLHPSTPPSLHPTGLHSTNPSIQLHWPDPSGPMHELLHSTPLPIHPISTPTSTATLTPTPSLTLTPFHSPSGLVAQETEGEKMPSPAEVYASTWEEGRHGRRRYIGRDGGAYLYAVVCEGLEGVQGCGGAWGDGW